MPGLSLLLWLASVQNFPAVPSEACHLPGLYLFLAAWPGWLASAIYDCSYASPAPCAPAWPSQVGSTQRVWVVDKAADGRKLVAHTKGYTQVGT